MFNLHTLYTQLCRITLVALVLPRLLAPVFATTSFCTYQHNSRTWTNFTTTIVFLIPVNLIGHTFVHCLTFFTAAIRWGVFVPHVDDSSLKSTKDYKHTKFFLYKPNPSPYHVILKIKCFFLRKKTLVFFPFKHLFLKSVISIQLKDNYTT